MLVFSHVLIQICSYFNRLTRWHCLMCRGYPVQICCQQNQLQAGDFSLLAEEVVFMRLKKMWKTKFQIVGIIVTFLAVIVLTVLLTIIRSIGSCILQTWTMSFERLQWFQTDLLLLYYCVIIFVCLY